jgi:sugar O-acyltransferase (sialic acid O-acetyltransferase NeuD family)
MDRHNNKTVLYGCGGHSRSVADIILLNDPETLLLFVDDNARDNEKLLGFDVVKHVPSAVDSYIIAIGDNQKRKIKLAEVGESNLVSVISKNAHLGFNSSVGRGCFIGNYCHIGPEAVIGENTIVNNGAVVEHEVVLGCHCHIGPNATVSGRCKIGDLVFVGVGATVKDYITICSNVVIGAGATVVKDIVEPGTYVGTPAYKLR